MKHAPIVALALMAALVAGCGGGSSTRITDLEEELAATQDKLDAAQAAQEEARKAEEAAEAARLEAARKAAAAQEEEARKAEEAAEAARLEAARQAAAAREAVEEQLRQEQEARQEAESKATELEEEAGRTGDQLVQANARRYFVGLGIYLEDDIRAGTPAGPEGDPTVTPRNRRECLGDHDSFRDVFGHHHRQERQLGPDVVFAPWRRFHFDRLDVYSDAESPALRCVQGQCLQRRGN